MAWDTSRLTPDAVRLLEDGISPEQVASAFGLPSEWGPHAVRQYARKFDRSGNQVRRNGDPVHSDMG